MQRLEPRADDTRSQIREKALRMGFDAVGFSKASLGPEVRERLSILFSRAFTATWVGSRLDRSREATPNVFGPKREV